jgi:hypothetical protein
LGQTRLSGADAIFLNALRLRGIAPRGEAQYPIARQIAVDLDADGEDRAVVVVDEAGSEACEVAVRA